MKPEIYKTGEAAELIQKLRVTGVGSNGIKVPYQRNVLYSLPIDLVTGDLLDIRAYGQTSNPNLFSKNQYGVTSSAIMFCYGIILADYQMATDGLEITEVRGTNILYEVNHSPWDCGDYYKYTGMSARKYINVICYAASMAINPSSTPTFLTCDADYGRLSIALFR